MEINCKIIEDLLPLYAEGLTSQESAAAVEAHISQCEHCRGVLEQLRTPSKIIPAPTEGLKKVRKEIRRKWWVTGLFCVFLTASVLLGLFTLLYQPEYLTSQEAISHVEAEDNQVTVYFTPQTERCRYTREYNPETGRYSVTFIAYRRTWDLYREDAATVNPKTFENVAEIWYAATDSQQEDTLLWGSTDAAGRLSLPWLGMRFYYLLALVSGILLGALWLILRRKKWGNLFGVGAIYSLCYSLCAVFTTGGTMLIYDTQDQIIIFGITALLAALSSGTILTGILHCRNAKR